MYCGETGPIDGGPGTYPPFKKANSKWIIVETYYKHGEYNLIVLNNNKELYNYLINKLDDYNYKFDYEYYKKACEDEYLFDELINIVEKIGNERVDSQRGWGVREIRMV